ncbi:MAG: hypothetical protein KAJ70_00195 [Candidatus Omnitrophica bacterium]|nr:hypothetical protein [Candidatus Omnitrophota bacterium]
MKKDEILRLKFQPDITWGYEILNRFSNEMSASYKKGFAKELVFSITQKMEMFSYITLSLNQKLNEIRDVLKTDSRGVKECLDNGYAYSEIKDELKIAFVCYLDSAIFESDSLCELLEKFSREVMNNILMDKRFCLKCEIAKKDFDMEWRKDLRRIRNDWIHNYHGWLVFQKNGDNFESVIEVPRKARGKNFKKDKNINIILINRISKGVNEYLRIIQDILVEKITALKQ